MRFYIDQILKDAIIDLRCAVRSALASAMNTPGEAEYRALLRYSKINHQTIDVVVLKKILYVPVQKAATSKIRRTLSEIAGRRHFFRNRRTGDVFGNPPTLRSISVADFHSLISGPDVLRFTFVRNPYDRLVSAWANKFQDRPLVYGKKFTRGTPEMDTYLKVRASIDPQLPHGPDQRLSFPEFVRYAIAICDQGLDNHIQLQSRLIEVPGVSLNFIGKIENFNQDIEKLLDHCSAPDALRAKVLVPVNKSKHTDFARYYTPELSKDVWQAYRSDFERFGYEELRI